MTLVAMPDRDPPAAGGSSRGADPAGAPGDWRGYGGAILLALAVALFVRTFVAQAFKIPSESMYPAILVGDHVLVNKFVYGFRVPFTGARFPRFTVPARGDVVVFAYPPDPSVDYIKRVVAVEGEVVEVRAKRLYINGAPAEDPRAVFSEGESGFPEGRDRFGPLTVPPGTVFVMGDNRDNSRDSRFWGPVPVSDIKGKAMLIYWSADLSKPLLPWLRWPWDYGNPEKAILYVPRTGRLGMAVR